MPYPLSLQMYTVREITNTPDDYRNILREVAQIGYAGIEGGAPSDMSPREFRRFMDDLGLKISSIWADPTHESIGEVVDIASEYQVTQVVGCWGPDQVKDLDEIKKTAAHFQRSAELLAPHGLEMAYHNHWWEFEQKVDSRYAWDLLFEYAPNLKCEIDLYWASNFGEVEVPSLVAKYAAKTPLVHAKDGSLVKDEPNTACGQGKMNLLTSIGAADPEVLKWIVVELDAYVGGAENVMDAVRDSFAYLIGSGVGTGSR